MKCIENSMENMYPDVRVSRVNPLTSKISFSNSPYCLPYSSCDVSLENLVLDQLMIPQLMFFFILITCLLDIALTL